MPALRLEGLEKTYPGGAVAVAGVDLEIAEGEMVVLLGPSGCGKSTLLRLVAGVESPTRGRIRIGPQDVTALPPQKRDIAMVFQSYALYPHMSVRDNLGFGLRMRGLDRQAIAARVGEVAAMLGIEMLLDRKPAQLSGGQRQRVALGRAVARRAQVFLLDEPLSNLDVQLRAHTRTELARLHRGLDVPMLYVTHDQEEAMTLGDRVVVMRAGRFLQVGPPMEIYARPATAFVGGFVGSPRMNFFPATLGGAGGGGGGAGPGIPVDGSGAVLRLQAPRGGDAAGQDVLLGVRPEDIELVEPARADLLARADVVEPLGREVLLHLVAAEAGGALRVLAPGGATLAPGAEVGVRLRRDRLHLFDAVTEERLPSLVAGGAA
jgi:multiple sugar transport system ATP-binding protein